MRKNKNQNKNKQNSNNQDANKQNPTKLIPALVTLKLKILPHSCSLEQFIEVLHANDIFINILQLITWLSREEIIDMEEVATKDAYMPIADKYEDEQLLIGKYSTLTKSDGTTFTYPDIMITCKGQCYFLNKLIHEGVGCK